MIKNYYDELYRKRGAYHFKWIENKNIFYLQHSQIILNLAKRFGNGKILDVGCGDGYISSRLSKNFKDVIGIDISREALKIARKKNPKITFIVADCTNLPFSDESFETIVASEIIEHLTHEDGKKFLNEASRVLKPHGVIIASSPNISNPYMKFLQLVRKNKEHLKEYTRKEFKTLISSEFKIVYYTSQVNISFPLIKFVKMPKCCQYVIGEKKLKMG